MNHKTYKEWAQELLQRKNDADPIPHAHDFAGTADEEPIDAVQFLKTNRTKYAGEVGRKKDTYVFHFYPNGEFPKDFEDLMGDAFLAVYKFHDRLSASYAPELESWCVKVEGYGTNPFADEMAIKLFDKLDKLLETQ